MIETQTILDQLKQPLQIDRVKKRAGGGGNQLSYIEAHDAISTLNRIFGYDGWHFTLLQFEQFTTPKGLVFRQTVRLAVSFEGKSVAREDVGIGIASNGNSDQLEKGMKEAVSDGLKRAARMLGDQFGNELYDKLAPEHNGQQRAAIATTAQLQECEALRQKAVQLGFRVKSGAEPKKQEDGAEEAAILAKTDAFRKYIQEHGDKSSDGATPRHVDRWAALNEHAQKFKGYLSFIDACEKMHMPFAGDAAIAAFEDAATRQSNMAVVAEDLLNEDWAEYAVQVGEGLISWSVAN